MPTLARTHNAIIVDLECGEIPEEINDNRTEIKEKKLRRDIVYSSVFIILYFYAFEK